MRAILELFFWTVGMMCLFYFLPQVFWPLSIIASAIMWPYIFWEKKKKIKKYNEAIYKRWTGAIKSDDPSLEGVVTSDVKKDGIAEQKNALQTSHSVSRVKDKAIWAVVSEFDATQTMKTLAFVCDAFRKLGRKELADRLWAEASKEDFGLNPLAKQEADHAHL